MASQPAPVNNKSVDDEGKDETSKSGKKSTVDPNAPYHPKLFSAYHIAWVVLFLLSIYNYGTDVLVTLSWLNYDTDDACPNFRDSYHCVGDAVEAVASAGSFLLGITTLGFIFGLCLRLYELKVLIQIYKHAKTQGQLESYQLKLLLTDMYSSFLPLFFEDIIGGLVTVTVTITTIGRDLSGIDYDIIMQSLAVTSINLSLNYIRFMYTLYTKRDKLSNYNIENSDNYNSNQETQNENTGDTGDTGNTGNTDTTSGENRKKCGRRGGAFMTKFCIFFYGIIGIGLLFAIIFCWARVTDVEKASEDYDISTNAYIEYMPYYDCQAADVFGLEGTKPEGDVKALYYPDEIIENKYGCDISQYDLWIEFVATYDFSNDIWLSLNATLNYQYLDTGDFSNPNCSIIWSGYPNQNESLYHLGSGNVYCQFNVPFEFCGNYTIPCQFAQGEAKWYVCFDYCEFDL